MREIMNGNTGFEEDIKPLFRPSDRACMLGRGIDLWDWWHVRRDNVAIKSAIDSNNMPPGEPWSNDKKELFNDWVEEGMPYWRAHREVAFFTEIDGMTEFEDPAGSALMQDARIVMGYVLPDWKEYAEAINAEEAAELREDLALTLEVEFHKESILKIDQMLCDAVDNHFWDAASNSYNQYAMLDAYENFGRGRFPIDQERAEIEGHFDAAHHRMDSTSMWFNWAGQIECAFFLLGENDSKQPQRNLMMAGLIQGCLMDFVFRLDAKGAQLNQANPRARTDSSFEMNRASENRIRKIGKRYADNWDRSSSKMKELYRYYQGIIF